MVTLPHFKLQYQFICCLKQRSIKCSQGSLFFKLTWRPIRHLIKTVSAEVLAMLTPQVLTRAGMTRHRQIKLGPSIIFVSQRWFIYPLEKGTGEHKPIELQIAHLEKRKWDGRLFSEGVGHFCVVPPQGAKGNICQLFLWMNVKIKNVYSSIIRKGRRSRCVSLKCLFLAKISEDIRRREIEKQIQKNKFLIYSSKGLLKKRRDNSKLKSEMSNFS